MGTLKTTLKLCTQAFQTDWDVALQAAALAYRATPHTVTGHTPFFLETAAMPLAELHTRARPDRGSPRSNAEVRPCCFMPSVSLKLSVYFALYSGKFNVTDGPCDDASVRPTGQPTFNTV